MSSEDHVVSFSLEVNVEKAYKNVRKLMTVVTRTFGLLRRLGLPPGIDAMMNKIQRFIVVVNTLRLTMAAAKAEAGPIGWALLAVSAGTTAVTLTDFVETEMNVH